MGNGADGLRVNSGAGFTVKTAVKPLFFTLLMLIQVFQACSGIPSLVPHYDDGGAESFWSDYYPNGVAVRLTPPSSRWRITAILIYGFIIDRGEKFFIVEVRDSGFNAVFKAHIHVSGHFKNATLDWARVSLPGVIASGDLYVCVYPVLELNGTQLWIAVDNDTVSDRSFLVDCYKQEVKKHDGGIAMIRVEGEEATDFVEIVPDSIFAEEEAKKIYEQAWEERRIIEDFGQKKFKEHLKGAVGYFARLSLWAEELTKRVGKEYGFELKIDANSKTFFITTFDSTGMNDEQVIEEILKRVSAMVKVEAMLLNEDKMNEFLASRGIAVRSLSAGDTSPRHRNGLFQL